MICRKVGRFVQRVVCDRKPKVRRSPGRFEAIDTSDV
jgi:hypothetical protein